MAERRSLGAAMSLDDEKLAFISGQKTTVAAPALSEPAPSVAKTSTTKEVVRRPRTPRTPKADFDDASLDSEQFEDLPPILVSLTTRLSPTTADSLRRASLELRLQRRKPNTQQEIIEAAVRHWLKSNGFLQAS